MNVVPYIDVMLVLLVIFMVTAPMFTPGVIDVPSVSRARSLDVRPIEVILDKLGRITVKAANREIPVASPEALVSVVQQLVTVDQPVAISANKDLKYADIVKVVDMLHQAGVKRVALAVKQHR